MMSDNLSIMTIPCGFKIRKKVDVKTFTEECMNRNQTYCLVIDDEIAIFFEKDKNGEISITEKYWDLYNPFNPTLEVANTSNPSYKETVYDYIWRHRKYINAAWFNN